MAKVTTKKIQWLPSAANGTSITPSGASWTNTGWTQFLASSGAILQIVCATYVPGVSADFEIEFGIGGAGSEVGIGSVHARALSLIATGGNYELMLGAIIDLVPNATRLSLRLRTDSTDVTAWKFAIGYILSNDSTDLTNQTQVVTPGAQNLSATVSSGGTWTSGSYLQITTSFAIPQYLTSLSINPGGTNEEWELDIGTGSAGNEVVITTLRGNTHGANGTGYYVMPSPLYIAGGVAVSARIRAATGTFNTYIALNTVQAVNVPTGYASWTSIGISQPINFDTAMSV